MLNALFRRAARRARAHLFRLAVPCLGVFSLGMSAASAAEPATPDQAPPLPFEHYKGWRDEPLKDWRAVNDRVGEVGGWRTYLRESQPAGGGEQESGGHHGHHGH